MFGSLTPENFARIRRYEGSVSGERPEDGVLKSEDGDRDFCGSRWPQEETLALLNIRSDMDLAFRDSCVKSGLWDDVSRKLAELGFNRTGKKCKEKFENLCKYHKRTKEGRLGRHNSKLYRFFEQLEALETQSEKIPTMPLTMDTLVEPINTYQHPEFTFATSTSMSEDDLQDTRKRKNRDVPNFFEKLMKKVIDKQETLQKQFIDAIEKIESERRAREDEWRAQELEKIKRDQEMFAQERAISAAKDAVLIEFLQRMPERGKSKMPQAEIVTKILATIENGESREKYMNRTGSSLSSRWPKPEVDALIRLRTEMDNQYQDTCSKGPLWDEISLAMKKLGYDRSPKRCKEKWENINKYFRRVKDSNRKRTEDSKTCPYFHQLDALYRGKNNKTNSPAFDFKPEELLMQIVGEIRPVEDQHVIDEEDGEIENVDHSHEEDKDYKDGEDAYQISANKSSISAMG